MKEKFTLIVGLGIALCNSMMAGEPNSSNFLPEAVSKSIRTMSSTLPTPSGVELPVLRKASAPTDNTVIYEAPEGEVIHYTTSGEAYMAISGMVGSLPVENFDTEMVFCEDGSVYWKNCITQALPNSYIKGTDKGDCIEFSFPQCIMSYPDGEGGMVDIYAHRMKYTVIDETTGEGWFFVDEENDKVVLKWGEDGTLSGDVMKGESILGMTTPEGEWYGYGNYDIFMTPGLETAVEVPEGLVTEPWAMISEGVGRMVRVGFDNDDIYMTSLFDYMPEAWVKGHIENGKAVFPNQFTGIVELLQCSGYLRAITMEYDEEYGDYMPCVQEDGLTFDYNPDTKELICVDKDIYLSLMGGPGYLFEFYLSPTIRWQPENFEISLPNPVILDCFNYDDRINYGVVAFNLPALTKEGYVLNPENIYYRMFVDGEPYTFQPDEFTDLEEPLEWLPYMMDNFDIHCEGEYHQIDHYLFDVETFGIQAMYTDGETEYFTDIISATVTGIDSPSDSKEVSAIIFTTLDGRRVENPAKGICLKTVTYSDGTTRTFKEAVR